MKRRTKIHLGLLIGIIISQAAFLLIYVRTYVVLAPTDVDKITAGPYAGNYLVTDGDHTIKIINFTSREIRWQTDIPAFFCHESGMMPDGNSILIADTSVDRVIEVDLNSEDILWEWNAKNSTHINWTKFALDQGWSQQSIEILEDQNPETGYFTHLNKVQFINGSDFGRSYDTILISLRNFDLVIEVNYTATNGEPGFRNITWHYGVPGDTSILFNQHAPKRWNVPGHVGHTTICDSDNGRVIEVDENNQIVWELTNLKWPRDCEILPNGNYLILDTNNKRVIEVTNDTKKIVKTFSLLLFNPYEIEYDDDKRQVIVGNLMQNSIMIYDYDTGKLVDMIGFPVLFTPLIIIVLIDIAYHSIDVGYKWRAMKGKSIKERLKSPQIYKKIISIAIMTCFTLLIYYFLSFFWHYCLHHVIENVPAPGL